MPARFHLLQTAFICARAGMAARPELRVTPAAESNRMPDLIKYR